MISLHPRNLKAALQPRHPGLNPGASFNCAFGAEECPTLGGLLTVRLEVNARILGRQGCILGLAIDGLAAPGLPTVIPSTTLPANMLRPRDSVVIEETTSTLAPHSHAG